MWRKLGILVLAFFGLTTPLTSQAQKPRSAEECAARVPAKTGAEAAPGAPEQRNGEAIYFACRLGVSEDDVRSWQKQLAQGYGEGRYGQLWDARLTRNKDGEFAILTTIVGTAHCQDIAVMKKSAGDWAKAWQLPDRLPLRLKHCAKGCPLMKVSLDQSGVLSVGIPADSNMEPQLKCRVKWLRYRWDGKTFVGQSRAK